ncbi:hypothetical protein QHF84_38490 [Polyangium sp. y55x31]|nr:hypothetical protein [Polyangium sp. y55x31]
MRVLLRRYRREGLGGRARERDTNRRGRVARHASSNGKRLEVAPVAIPVSPPGMTCAEKEQQ